MKFGPFEDADPAKSPTVSVETIVRMALWATAFFCVCGGRSVASQSVNLRCHRFKVRRVDAMSYTTKMVQLQTLFYRSAQHFVRIPMRAFSFFVGHLNLAVTIRGNTPSPIPTTARKLSLFPKSLESILSRSSHWYGLWRDGAYAQLEIL